MLRVDAHILIPALSIPGIYLLHFLFQAFVGGRLRHKGNTGAIGVNLLALALSLWVAVMGWEEVPVALKHSAMLAWTGIPAVSFYFTFDNTAALMLCLVTLITLIVTIYSTAYMRGEEERQRYWAYLSLFTGAMTGLVLSGSLFTLFIFWEGVGFASWLLIGFWRTREAAARGSMKAFLVNRASDVFFLIGICLLFSMQDPRLSPMPLAIDIHPSHHIHWGLIFIFLGAAGKSAQFPFQAWLPDAMAGPTPVSSLLHAATMVAAGVYVMIRLSPMLQATEETLIAIVGAITALIGAFSALGQTNIKRVLAFSTISQLGLMMFAIGTGAARASEFHLFTHAFFKCGLFLSAGAIIHSLHHWKEEQEKQGVHLIFDPEDLRTMGGLRKMMPKTFWLYLVFAASLAGIPLTGGFLSKEGILSGALIWSGHTPAWTLVFTCCVWFTAFLTPFYMMRHAILIFGGNTRLPLPASGNKPQDAAPLMWLPLVLLAIACLGILWEPLQSFIHPVGPPQWLHASLLHHPQVMLASLLLVLLGLLAGWLLYRRGWDAKTARMETGFVYLVSSQQLYFDQIYTWIVAKPALLLARSFYWIDKKVFDGFINGVALAMVSVKGNRPSLSRLFWRLDTHVFDWLVNGLARMLWNTGGRLRRLQSGKLQAYLSLSLLGLLLLLGAFIYFVIS